MKLEEMVGKRMTEAQFDEAAGEKDACYRKVKARYDVWPSAYASGALVKCRKVGAKNWGNKSKKESVDERLKKGQKIIALNPKDKTLKGKVGVIYDVGIGNSTSYVVQVGKGKKTRFAIMTDKEIKLKESVDERIPAGEQKLVYQFKRLSTSEMDELDAMLSRAGIVGTPDFNKKTWSTYANRDAMKLKKNKSIQKFIKSKGGKQIDEGTCGYGLDGKLGEEPAGPNLRKKIKDISKHEEGLGDRMSKKLKKHKGVNLKKKKSKLKLKLKGRGVYQDYDGLKENTNTIKVWSLDEKCWKGYEKKGMKTMFGKRYPNCVKKEGVQTNVWMGKNELYYESNTGESGGYTFEYDNNDLNEAEYQGRKVKLGKIMQGDTKKFKVYVKNPKGNTVKVNFGQGGDAKGGTMRIRKSNPKARKAFRSRHNCDNPGPRHKARYWSCRKW